MPLDLPDSGRVLPIVLVSLLFLLVPITQAFGQNRVQNFENVDDTSNIRAIDLLSPEYDWHTVNRIEMTRSDSDLKLKVDTDQDEEIYHRAVMETNISGIPTLLTGEYSARSVEGEAIYGISIRDLQNNSKWWTRLGNSGGQVTNLSFQIPENLWSNNVNRADQGFNFRLHLTTEDPGVHFLDFENLELLTIPPRNHPLATAMPWLFPSR